MKKLVFRVLVVAALAMAAGNGTTAMAQDHDSATDSISIDDMAPVLYDEEAYEEEEKGSNGVIVGIAIGAIVVLGAGFMVMKKKKK